MALLTSSWLQSQLVSQLASCIHWHHLLQEKTTLSTLNLNTNHLHAYADPMSIEISGMMWDYSASTNISHCRSWLVIYSSICNSKIGSWQLHMHCLVTPSSFNVSSASSTGGSLMYYKDKAVSEVLMICSQIVTCFSCLVSQPHPQWQCHLRSPHQTIQLVLTSLSSAHGTPWCTMCHGTRMVCWSMRKIWLPPLSWWDPHKGSLLTVATQQWCPIWP